MRCLVPVLIVLAACGDNGLTVLNTAPDATILSPVEGQSLVEDASMVLTARISDAESLFEDLTVVWSTDRGPLVGEFGTDGDVSTYTIDGLPSGSYDLTLTVVDPEGESTEDSVSLTVFVNAAPEIAFVEPEEGAQIVFGEPVTVRISASDDRDAPDDLDLFWTGATGPEAPNADGSATVVLTDLAVGAHSVSVEVQDTLGAAATATLGLFVTDGDVDGDGFTAVVLGGTDCDDGNGDIFPGAEELCNDVDDDCDDTIDESNPSAPSWYLDDDDDGFGAGPAVLACSAPDNHVADNTDCDDTRNAVNPDATEICNDRDDNCDTVTDTDATDRTPFYADTDNDGFGAGAAILACEAPSGRVGNADDCNDNNDAIKPGATEVCNGEDDNCDTVTDTDAVDRSTHYRDGDTDGFGTPDVTELTCSPSPGFVDNADDCDDVRGSVNPDADEICNDIDDDCDSRIDVDPVNPPRFYLDDDDDDYGTPDTFRDACDPPTGFVDNALDCNDGDPLIHPFIDADDDGRHACADCDDNNPQTYPGAPEQCDGLDNDCNDSIPSIETTDGDGDDAVTCDDCNDNDGSVFPGATEVCNAVDDNCSGNVDDGDNCSCPVYQAPDGTAYQFCEGSLNWGAAFEACDGDNYVLVSIESASENTFLRGVIETFPWDTPPTGQSADDAWWTAGFRDTGSGGQFCSLDAPGRPDWMWSNGGPFSYTNWRAGEPNNRDGFGCEGCIEIWLDDATGQPRAEWNDEDCGAQRNYICEAL